MFARKDDKKGERGEGEGRKVVFPTFYPLCLQGERLPNVIERRECFCVLKEG